MNFLYKIINKTTWGPFWVMYDNDCLFCCRIMKIISALDIFDKVQWVDKNWDGDFPEEEGCRLLLLFIIPKVKSCIIKLMVFLGF